MKSLKFRSSQFEPSRLASSTYAYVAPIRTSRLIWWLDDDTTTLLGELGTPDWDTDAFVVVVELICPGPVSLMSELWWLDDGEFWLWWWWWLTDEAVLELEATRPDAAVRIKLNPPDELSLLKPFERRPSVLRSFSARLCCAVRFCCCWRTCCRFAWFSELADTPPPDCPLFDPLDRPWPAFRINSNKD